ncbi:LOW QUALITY PROTEIN: uncharacterized protein LOC142536837 [Primulina tabacum]|uniref:LOW QUALITY PROTEIN: uncharacterized protein LOC142536837 n=1 Tax=Primulina tabacum TaxID=48773 RepID=UPI003F5A35AB
MARKVVSHQRHVGGLEAPRNSLELPVETSYGVCAANDNILYAYKVKKGSSDKNCHPSEAPIKKLISEEIAEKQKMKKNSPSIVARLMGVDMLPFDSKAAGTLVEVKNRTLEGKLLGKERSEKGSVPHVLPASNPSQQLEFGSFNHHIDSYSDTCGTRVKLNKPKPREHPQEEELKRFKKEFEAWQAARFRECSKVVEYSSDATQLIARADLNREKTYCYANSKRNETSDRPKEPKDLAVLAGPHETLALQNCKMKGKYYPAEEKESLYSNTMSQTEICASQMMNSDLSLDMVSAPTKIVILQPAPRRLGLFEDSWNNTPSTSEERGSIEDFLEEVKERLKNELQGKSSKKRTTARGGEVETPYWGKPSEPKQIAQRIAQQVREGVTKELGVNLHRSESTRSYRSEIQFNGTGSPEFINRDTRRFLTERLTNVLKGETRQEISLFVPDRSKRSVSGNDKMSYSDSFSNELETQSVSFRRELDDSGVQHKQKSPRNLVRSLSAPVSGTSFGKLLLEDRHILTGAQIRRKHEVFEKASLTTKKKKKDRFNIKQKVSNFKYSLTLKGRLFRRRVKSISEPNKKHNHLLNDITSGPTVVMNFCETRENFTEVPPSPASVCSSIHEECWGPTDYLSTTPSSGVHQLEESEMPQVFKEINSNLNELRIRLNQLEGSFPEETINDQQPREVEVDIEDPDEAFVRDLLVAADLYDGSHSRSLSKWDPLGKSISYQVFEEVEDSYRRQTTKDKEICTKYHGEKLSHKMILDLLNEVLPTILKQPLNVSRYIEKATGFLHKAPRGKKLLCCLWKIIQESLHPADDESYYSLDNLLARDLQSKPWSCLMDDDINVISREIESQITKDMIDEMIGAYLMTNS